MTRNWLLYGAPGSGKGTQAEALVQRFSIPHIATGDILRAEVRSGSELGQRAQAIMATGALLPDDVMIDIVRARLAQPDCSAGFILDGFPRTLPQALALDGVLGDLGHPLDRIVYLRVSEEELLARTGGRGRDDDKPEAVRHRIQVYLEETLPVLDHYRPTGLVREIDGEGEVSAVSARVLEALGEATA